MRSKRDTFNVRGNGKSEDEKASDRKVSEKRVNNLRADIENEKVKVKKLSTKNANLTPLSSNAQQKQPLRTGAEWREETAILIAADAAVDNGTTSGSPMYEPVMSGAIQPLDVEAPVRSNIPGAVEGRRAPGYMIWFDQKLRRIVTQVFADMEMLVEALGRGIDDSGRFGVEEETEKEKKKELDNGSAGDEKKTVG